MRLSLRELRLIQVSIVGHLNETRRSVGHQSSKEDQLCSLLNRVADEIDDKEETAKIAENAARVPDEELWADHEW